MVKSVKKGAVVRFCLVGEDIKVEGLVLDVDDKNKLVKLLYLNNKDDSIHTCYRKFSELFTREGDNTGILGVDKELLREWDGLLRYKRSCVEVKLSVIKAAEEFIKELNKE